MEVQSADLESNVTTQSNNTKRVKPLNILILSIVFFIFAGILVAIILLLNNQGNPTNNKTNDVTDDLVVSLPNDDTNTSDSDNDDSNTSENITDSTEGTLVEADNFNFTCPQGWEVYSNSMYQNLFRTYECTLSLGNNNFAFNNGILTSFTFIDPAVDGFDSQAFHAIKQNIMEGGGFTQDIKDNYFYTYYRTTAAGRDSNEYINYYGEFTVDRYIYLFQATAEGSAFDNYEPLEEIEKILDSFETK